MNTKKNISTSLSEKSITSLLLQYHQAPKNFNLLQQLGLYYAQQGDVSEAKKYFKEAELIDSNSPLLKLCLGKTYKLSADFEKAASYFQQLLHEGIYAAETHNEYGLLFYQQKKYEEAKDQFLQALKYQPDYIDAMYHLSLVLHAQGNTEESIAGLLAILELKPKHLHANFLLGKFLVEKNKVKDAVQYFSKITEENPTNKDILENIIRCLLEENHYLDAKLYCELLVKIDNQSIEGLYNLGVICSRSNKKDDAISYYLSTLQIDPHYFPALNNVAILYLERQNIAAAQHFFNQALKQQPTNESIQYILNVISKQEHLHEAPHAYIQNLFNGYADHFEEHLCQALDYQVPNLLKKYLEKMISATSGQLSILDLGCGTGLCGTRFKPYAKNLIGVDLSPNMIAIAKAKAIYDELYAKGNMEYLQQQIAVFDLILAADVFVYQGDLGTTLRYSHQALKENGLLAFSTEICDGEKFELLPTGRFAHSKKYIMTLAEKHGFSLLKTEIIQTRLQGQEYLKGYIFILEKKPSCAKKLFI